MIVLEITQDKANELRDNLIVVCEYQTKQGEQVFGIDMMYKSQYPDFEEIEVLNPNAIWHEDKPIQIIQNKSGVVWGAMNEPEIAMGLAMHRQTTNMATYEEGDKLYFYANSILPEHQAIFDAFPNLEITINEA